MMKPIYNAPEEAVEATPQEAVQMLLAMAKLGPVQLSTRRSGWSCDVWPGRDYAGGEDDPPTVRGYGYHHGPHGAVATAWAKLVERGMVAEEERVP